MSGSAVNRSLKLGLKIGAVGGALYLSVQSGIWSRDTTQNAVAVKEFTESVDGRLGGGYISKVGMPSSDSLAGIWNRGVTATFDKAADIPATVSQRASRLKKYFSDSIK